MANKDDYLVDYSAFFKTFAETLNPNDPLPVKLGSYKFLNTEVIGGVIDWTTQYLNQKNCPTSLLAPLINITICKTREKCKVDPRTCGFNAADNAYEPLRLMQSVVARCNEICSLYLDNSLLCTLPPPNGHYHRYPVSVSANKNGRRRMEDRHVVIHDLNTILNLHEDVTPSSYFAVFDGHAGHDAAVYSATHLHQYLGESEHFPNNPEMALTDAFFKTDAYFVQKCEVENFSSGTTAVCVLLRPQEKYLYVAWVGDSMALLANKGRILQCVNPHKPGRKDEQDRIEKAGGSVVYWGTWRVNGQLAVSRAIGDTDFKPSVVATPDIHKVALHGGEDFIILACDGLWDYVNDDLAAKEVYSIVCKNPEDAEGVSHVLVKLAKYKGSADNISVIVVFLRDPREVAADAQWLLETISEDIASEQDTSAAAAAAAGSHRPHSIVEGVSEVIRAAADMDSAAGLDNNNPFANNDAATTGEHVQKDPFLLDLESFKQQTTAISSVPNNDFFVLEQHSTNGKQLAEDMFNDDDDFGPESNVDGDSMDNLVQIQQEQKEHFDNTCFSSVLTKELEGDTEICHQEISPTLLAAKAIAEGMNNSKNEGLLHRLEEEIDMVVDREFHNEAYDFVEEVIGEKVPAIEEAVNPTATDDVHDVADSGEESEDEWNYFKGNTAADTDKENIDPTTNNLTVNLEGDESDMSQLNPNAAEFVPVSPTRNTASPTSNTASPLGMSLINDTICAQSPKRIPAEPVEMDVPEPNDFETEIRSRPSDICSAITNNRHAEPEVVSSTSVEDMENFLNGKNDFKSTENFHFGPNATAFASSPAKFLDDSEAFSTKANFGDETSTSTVAFLDTTSVSSPGNNPFGDQTDFQAIMNKESDPMSMSFYQDKDDKADTNPFDLNAVQMLPDNLDAFLAKPNDEKSSDLPEHEQQRQQQEMILTTDLDKPLQVDDDLLSGVREFPKSPYEDIVTPEPTFDENLCPNNEVVEKESNVNISSEIHDLCGQIKDMAMDDTSFTESEIEYNRVKPQETIPEEVEEPQICVMQMREGTNLIECHMMAPSEFDDNQAVNQQIVTPEVGEMKELIESPQPIIEDAVSNIQTPVDDVTSSIKDDVSPVQLPRTEFIPVEPAPAIVEEVVGAAAVVAAAAAVSKKAVATKETPQKKTTAISKTSTPKSTAKAAAATPKAAAASSPTKSAPKPLSAAKPPTPRTAAAAKPSSSATTAGKLTSAAPRPKTTSTTTKSATDKKPLLNGDSKSTASKPITAASIKPRVGTLPLNKTTAQPSSTAAARPIAARLSPTKPLASARPLTAPARTGAAAKPASALGAVAKPKSTATLTARATSATSKLTSTTSVTKTSATVTKTSSVTLTATNKQTAAKTTTSNATVPAKVTRAPITRTVQPKAPDAEKQNKENVNKQTASRTAAKCSALTNGKPLAITARKIEPKVAGITAKTTAVKSGTATATRPTAIKKSTSDSNRPITKTATTKTVNKSPIVNTTKSQAVPKINGLPNGLLSSEATNEAATDNSDVINADNAIDAMLDDLVVKDNSPIMENSQLINAD